MKANERSKFTARVLRVRCSRRRSRLLVRALSHLRSQNCGWNRNRTGELCGAASKARPFLQRVTIPKIPNSFGNAMPYATALAGACPWLSLDGNLLPAEQRRASSRVRLIPTFALGTILALLLVALALQSRWADGRYLGLLQHEIRRYEPQARKVNTLDKSDRRHPQSHAVAG